MRAIVGFFVLLLLRAPLDAATGASAHSLDAEWTRFRGPNGSGISTATNLPSSWTESDYRWKVGLPGTGHASPVIFGGQVFVLCGDKATARRTLLCLNTRDGKIVWSRDYASTTFAEHRENSYGTSTPVVDDKHVYVYWTTPDEITVLALDHQGKETWRRNLGPFKSQHGSGTSPVLFGDLLVIGNDQEGPSSIFGLDAATGRTRWEVKRRTDRAAYSAPLVRQFGRETELVFTSSGHGVTGIDPTTGRVNWELTNAFPFRVVGSPILADGLVVGSSGEGGVGRRLVAVQPGSGTELPRIVYEMKNSIPYVPTPVAKDGLLFLWGDNGLLACHRTTTGELVWREKISDSFYSSPIWAEGRLYGVSKGGTVYVVSAADKYRLIATMPLGEASFATPAVADGALFFRTAAHLICVGSNPHPELIHN